MAKFMTFVTDGAEVEGIAKEELMETTFVQEETGMAITDITQVSCGTPGNDADWQIAVDGTLTRYKWTAEEIDPTKVGRNRLLSPIRVRPRARLQFKWSGQAVATVNKLKVQYEPC